MTQTPKITQEGLKAKLEFHLEGTMIGQLMGRIKLQTDEQGNVLPHVIRNIKMALGIVMKMSPDPEVKGACKKTLGELNALLGEWMTDPEKNELPEASSVSECTFPVRTVDEQQAELRRRREAKELSPHSVDPNFLYALAQSGEPLRHSDILRFTGAEAVVLAYQDLVDLRAPFIFISRSGEKITVSPNDPEFEDDTVLVLFPEMLGEVEGHPRLEITGKVEKQQDQTRKEIADLPKE
jgi:hypothetical protein